MRCVCWVISTSTRSRSAVVSGRFCCVSMKPDSTVSGVRISCDTLATKSRRIASLRTRSVMSSDSTRRMPSPYSRTTMDSVPGPRPLPSTSGSL